MTDNRPEKIQNMFNGLAGRYDFMNCVISFGIQKFIKKSSLKLIELPKNAKIADLCCGTGDIANLLAKNADVERVFALDFSRKMLELAQKKAKTQKIEFISGDCTNLPFENESLDGCTMGFGLRNIPDYRKAAEQIHRVLKNGGFFLHLDIFKGFAPINSLFDFAALIFAKFFSTSPDSYKYLIKSKNDFLSPENLAKSIEKCGFKCKIIQKWAFGMVSAQLFVKDCSQQE